MDYKVCFFIILRDNSAVSARKIQENMRFSLFLKFEILKYKTLSCGHKEFRIYVPVQMAINSKFFVSTQQSFVFSWQALHWIQKFVKKKFEYKSLLNLHTNFLREMQMFCKWTKWTQTFFYFHHLPFRGSVETISCIRHFRKKEYSKSNHLFKLQFFKIIQT